MTDPASCLAEILGPQRMERLHLRAQQMELDDTALLRLVVEAFLGGHATQPLAPVQGGLFANTSLPPAPPQKKMRRSVLEGLVPAANRAEQAEIDWRVERVWEAHLKAHARFWTTIQGRAIPTAPAKPNAETRAAIVRSLRSRDAHLLGPDDRCAWVIESETRAAGVGIYYDAWMTGDNPSKTRYLGHDRPWVPQRGKEDPVSRFAALYFPERAIFDEQDRRAGHGHEEPPGSLPS